MRTATRDTGPSLFPDNDQEPDLMAAIAEATKLEHKAPPAPTVEPGPRASSLEREQTRRREKLDKLIHTPSVFDAIAKTTIECSNAGFSTLSIGILGDDTLIIQAFNDTGEKLDVTGTPRDVIKALRDLIIQSRANRNGEHS